MKTVTLICFLFFSSYLVCQTKTDTIQVLNTLFKQMQKKIDSTNYSKKINRLGSIYNINNETFFFTKKLFNEINQVGLIRNGIDTNNIKDKFLRTEKIKIDSYAKETKNIIFFDSATSNSMISNRIRKTNKNNLHNISLSTPIFINNICLLILSTESYVETYLFKKKNDQWEAIKKLYPIYDTVY